MEPSLGAEPRGSIKRVVSTVSQESETDGQPPAKRRRGPFDIRSSRGAISSGATIHSEAAMPKTAIELGLVEKREVYPIRAEKPLPPFSYPHPDLVQLSVRDPFRMRQSGLVPEGLVVALWDQKTRLDAVFDSGDALLYYGERDFVFPLDNKSSSPLWNRTGDKLMECHDAMNLFDNIPAAVLQGQSDQYAYLDICGAPGAFSQYLTATQPHLRPYGISLEPRDGAVVEKNAAWLSDVTRNKQFTRMRGADRTGNLYAAQNIEHVLQTVEQRGHKILLAVADGEFEMKKMDNGQHVENLQELFTGRLFISEVLLALKALEPRGNFVLKLFDTFTWLSVSLVYLLAQVFGEVAIVKPNRSRMVNSERYVVCKALDKEGLFDFVIEILAALHRDCGDETSPHSCVPLVILQRDTLFMQRIQFIAQDLCVKETRALQLVLDWYDYRRKT
jgi:cap1 methyltransferase